MIHIKTKHETPYGGQEFIAVKDYETMDELAKEEVKNFAESEGAVGMYADWAVEDALDTDAMLESMGERIEEDC